MRSRRSSSVGSRLLAGIIIVVSVVLIFSIVTAPKAPSAPTPVVPTNTSIQSTPTVVGSPSIAATVTNMAKPMVYRVVAEKAQLLAEIVEVHFNHLGEWDVDNLDLYAGHLQGTAELGKGGNYVLAGHVELKDGIRGPFAGIHVLEAGDQISIIGTLGNTVEVKRYTVTEVMTVPPDKLDVVRNHGYEELTLITCSDWSQESNSYETRLVVHARLDQAQ